MLKNTKLHSSHLSLSAKMGGFAGYDMPLYYDLGVKQEHEWVRGDGQAGIFDVSHMGQIILEGSGCAEFLEKITPSSFSLKKHGRAQYTVLTNKTGGIVDDLIITRLTDDKFFIVLNAGCKDKDIAWIKSHLPDGISMTYMEEYSLIALQGDASERVISDLWALDLSKLPYMFIKTDVSLGDIKVSISRLGYTGEDGFEISVHNDHALNVWEALVGHGQVKPIGLAARDSLRLDMGYCLYGHDIDDKTSPVEGDLTWVMGKKNQSFIGADIVLPHKVETSKKRVGLRLMGKGIAREGSEIRSLDDDVIGTLTSGGFSPTLGAAIGQGYVPMEYAVAGTKVFVNVRGRNIDAEIADMPFIAAKTKSMKIKS